MIYFDPQKKSQSGKLLPLEVQSQQPHNCPNSPYNQKKNANNPGTKLGGKSPAEAISELVEKVTLLEKRVSDLELNRWSAQQ